MNLSKKIAPAILFCLILTCCIATPAKADTFFTATLSGLNEVPANGSLAIGFITLDFSGTNLLVIESFAGLSSPATVSHLQCCVASGINGPVALPFPLFPIATSGTFMQMFDLSQSSVFASSFLIDGGSESLLLASLNAGLVYANISDTNFPGGEIRGQLKPTSTGGGGGSTVPEPSVLLSVVMGLAAIAAQLKRR
jgi:hypothetical protein